MIANIVIMALILGYCAYIIWHELKNAKEGKFSGCAGCGSSGGGGCSACGGNCAGCSGCSSMNFDGAVSVPDGKKR